ncbi:MAG TPA: condensation domain-containing protein, partial [Methylocystis sp.]|nr:condensation domain-containing protein [Methylocystis sp.]
LIAYVTGAGAEPAALRAALARELPDYMVPSAVLILETLPLTQNGKVDRKALPTPEAIGQATRPYKPPRNAAEETICRVWAESLGLERVGIDDNYFELGGHSLLAISLVERLRREGLDSEVRTLFAHPTPAGVASKIGACVAIDVPPNLIPAGCVAITPDMVTLAQLSPQEIDHIVAEVPGGAANIQDIYPLAPLQEGMLFHHLLAQRGDPYLVETVLGFVSRNRLDEFLAALRAVVARHDILRTSVVWENLSEPMQVVWREAPLEVAEIALDPDVGDAASQLRDRFGSRVHQMDLRRAPLLRGFCCHDPAADRWLLLLLTHHLAVDHTTLEVVISETRAHLSGAARSFAAPAPFRNFVAQARLGVTREEHEAFFRDMLSDVTEPTAPFGVLDVQGDGSGIKEAHQSLEPALSRRIRARARALGVSAASLLHQGFALVLARLCGRLDVVFGTVLFGRMQGGAGADRAVGVFINTLPVRARFETQSVSEAILGMHAVLTKLLRHESASLALAQRCSGVEAPTPLFTALLNYRHVVSAPKAAEDEATAWAGVESPHSEERTNYPITLSIDDDGEGFGLTSQTVGAIDPEQLCSCVVTALEGMIEALEASASKAARLVEILPPQERALLLSEWTASPRAYAAADCLPALFEAQAARAPASIAVVYEGEALSYGELNARANRLAHRLRAEGVGPDVLVGLCV